MNTTLIFAAAVSTVALAAPAVASDFYISGALGLSNPSSTVFNDGANGAGNPEVDINNASRLSAAVGYAITPQFRVELEFSKSSFETDNGLQSGSGGRAVDSFATDADLNLRTLMLNASYDFDTGTNLTPFVRAGIGKSFYDMSGGLFVSSAGGNTFGGFLPATFNYDGSGSNFAFQAGLGVAYDISDNTALTVEYRYGNFGRVATGYDANGDRLQTKLETHEIMLGLRYTFN